VYKDAAGVVGLVKRKKIGKEKLEKRIEDSGEKNIKKSQGGGDS